MERDGADTFQLRRQDLAWRAVDAEVIVLDTQTSRYLSVNRTGAVLWQLLSDAVSYDRLVTELVERCGADTDTARSDIDAFLTECAERGLLDGPR